MITAASIVDVPGVEVGQAQNNTALTGCTVVMTRHGAVAGVDVRGSAPGTRETDLLDPLNQVQQVHAICLSGGSAFGLAAATGVMRYLEENGHGLDVGMARIPIVPGAVLFDLGIGDPAVRPDEAMGYEAASCASAAPLLEGNVGAGTGATVGKLGGYAGSMKSGIGSASHRLPNGLVVGAIVAVNAVGEVRHPRTGDVLAGALDSTGQLVDSLTLLAEEKSLPPPGTNTTIAVVASNAALNKAQANKVAQMAHDGLARTIYPVHTMHDGDTIFALATGGVQSTVDLVGALSAEVLAEAVVRAVKAARAAGGRVAARDLEGDRNRRLE